MGASEAHASTALGSDRRRRSDRARPAKSDEPARRELPTQLPSGFRLPNGFREPRVVLPGVLVVQSSPAAQSSRGADFCGSIAAGDPINGFPLIVLVDDSDFAARSLNNFLWVTFTRSNPAADVDGIGGCTRQKHWGCTGSLVIDACRKPHHAPPLIEDPAVSRRVDALAAPGKPLHGIF